MKDMLAILEYYGKCCVSEYAMEHNKAYPLGVEGEKLIEQDALKLENIRGQKKAIEYIFNT